MVRVGMTCIAEPGHVEPRRSTVGFYNQSSAQLAVSVVLSVLALCDHISGQHYFDNAVAETLNIHICNTVGHCNNPSGMSRRIYNVLSRGFVKICPDFTNGI